MTGMLDGKVALVTGGGNGIGREAALAFAREGARVAVADYEAESARETVAMINAAGGQAISLSGDVTIAAQVQAMLDGVIAAYGKLDCAFNNAGIAPHQVDAGGMLTHEWSEDQKCGAGICRGEHSGQRGLPGLHRHPHDRPDAGHLVGSDHCPNPDAPLRRASGNRGNGGLAVFRSRELRHRRRL